MDVALFAIDLDAERADPAVLDDEERRRAASFAISELRDRFVAAHAALRRVLGHELGLAPAAVRITRRQDGRPVTDGLSFSLAHSGDLAVVGVSRSGQVGVDVELLANARLAHGLASALSEHERAALTALSARARPLAALAQWTRKEAYLKATGSGLRVEPRSFGLPVAPPTSGRQTHFDGWTIADLVLPGAIGAIAARAPKHRDPVRFLAPDRPTTRGARAGPRPQDASVTAERLRP